MAITIDWGTKIINVPKADLALIQASPTEIRELNLNTFRLALKALEASEEGMSELDTHRHNTEVSLGGITYARVIEIINGYTVTFEDGQYAVNLVGANSNVGDVVNVNQVSVRSANSAGLISNAAIEYSSFNGGVSWDSQNGYEEGTEFPSGTPQRPLKNLDDVMLVAEVRGFDTIFALADGTIDLGGDYRGMIFIGESLEKTTITIDPAANVENCEFYEMHIKGTLDGNAKLKNCRVGDLNYIYGEVERCLLGPGTIVLGGANEAHFLDCWSGVAGGEAPIIDLGGSGQPLAIRNYNGEIELRNKTGAEKVSIDLNSGFVALDSTFAIQNEGDVRIRGIGSLEDNSTGAAVVSSSLINNLQIANAVMEEPFADHVVPTSMGWIFSKLIRSIALGRAKQESGKWYVYDPDDPDVVLGTFDTKDQSSNPTDIGVYERVPV